MDSGIQGFSQRVLRYFLTFLETDFKRQQAPRRRIQLKTDTDFRCGMPLRKYPKLYEVTWSLAAQKISDGLIIKVPRRRFTAPISPTLLDLIRQHVAELPADSFEKVRSDALDYAKRHRPKATENPEKFVEDVQLAFIEGVGQRVVAPILALLDQTFRQNSYSAIESVYEIESDLTDALSASTATQLPTALNTYIVKGDLSPTQGTLEEFFSEKETKERVVSFFEDFATADAFQELRDLMNFARTADNLQFYAYFCEVRFGTAAYPLFYVPGNVQFDDSKSEYVIEFDPHLFVNKRAVDFILQERQGTVERILISPVDDRIVYLSETDSFIAEMEKILKKLVPALEVADDLDLRRKQLQTASAPDLKIANTAYFAIFDKADEALLNDYEELLSAINEDQKAAGGLFENIIKSFLLDEPKSFRETVDSNWDSLSVPERLVAISPIPVNEEQRKILAALREPDCNYLAIQGPPGTGKSHTITAIAFDCILNGWNVLVLSDKKEALDVVQDKLETAFAAVRHGGDDFPNPILRLGHAGGSYSRLISQSSQEKIRQHYRAHRANAEHVEAETIKTNGDLKKALEQTVNTYSQIKLSEVEELHRLELEIENKVAGYATHLQHPARKQFLNHLEVSLSPANGDSWSTTIEFLSQKFPSGEIGQLLQITRVYSTALQLLEFRKHKDALSIFIALGPQHQKTLVRFVSEYQALRMPLVGYLFRGSRVRALNASLGDELPCPNFLNLHQRVHALEQVSDVLGKIRTALEQEKLNETLGEAVYQILKSDEELPPGIGDAKKVLISFFAVFGYDPKNTNTRLAIDGKQFTDVSDFMQFITKCSRYVVLWQKIEGLLKNAPTLDYVGTKSRLEQLYTSKMTQEIDKRFLEFVDNNRTTAKTLGSVIKAKQQFPQDKFSNVKDAFPCIIAGVREFAEYVPLKQAIFDLVVIDEASQVSVAQAFPALLRAKKVIVFGDQKQFSNVKAAQASNMINKGYLTDIEAHFKANVSKATDKIQRLKQFDVKKSILEFFDLIASYSDMLRKHFRGYQELISFSSTHFYGGELQAIKVRGKPIEDVIRFTELAWDNRPEKFKNVNSQEAEFILNELKRMVDEEIEESVGVITPFREQLQYLNKTLFNDAYADKFESQLKLKIMTFDTCQGEERDIIFYSMVATPNHDVLNYVFPVSLENVEERVEDALKVQRLNVGFSRAKECIHFVLSKPVDQFKGSIGRALKHYKNILENKALPEAGDTDQNSPMEAKVLDWLKKTSFVQTNLDDIELIPQFPIGDYLKQLDKNYQHPAYRCDFLLRYFGDDETINIVIEYDGFAEHFIERKKIHEGNWDQYYRPEDIERQLIIESYGYKFLRLNRFNLGLDPVQTLSARLSELIHTASNIDEVATIANIRQTAEGLANGDVKHCRKCDKAKPIADFFDQALKSGEGAYGQICMQCKSKPKKHRSYSRGGYSSGWRKRW